MQGIEVSTFDEAFRTPSPEAHLVALRTQQVIALETGVTRVSDPLGGSWDLESLTAELEHRIREMIERIEAMGPPDGLCGGRRFRALFVDAMERRAHQLNAGRLVQVGVNAQQMPEAEDTLLRDVTERKIAPATPRIEGLRPLRRERDAGPVAAALRAACGAAEDRAAHLMPPLIAATEAGATIGEIAGALRAGDGRPPDPFGLVPLPWWAAAASSSARLASTSTRWAR